jgi:hypothetical protein
MAPAGYAEVLAVGGTVATNGINLCPLVTYLCADPADAFTPDGAFAGGAAPVLWRPLDRFGRRRHPQDPDDGRRLRGPRDQFRRRVGRRGYC